MADEYRMNATDDRSTFFKYFATAAGGIDILAQGPGGPTKTLNAQIHVLTAGDLSVTRIDGTVVLIPAVPAGYILPLSVRSINAASTASGILVLW